MVNAILIFQTYLIFCAISFCIYHTKNQLFLKTTFNAMVCGVFMAIFILIMNIRIRHRMKLYQFYLINSFNLLLYYLLI